MSEEIRTMEVRVYRTPDGRPTCSSDHRIGHTCKWLGSTKFGTISVCMLTCEAVDPAIGDDYGYITPHKICPIWKDSK